MELKIPGLKGDVGLGDVVKKVASALGIEQKPGCGCKKRQEKLNRALTFKGKEQAQEKPASAVEAPALPGYRAIDQCDGAVLYFNGRTYQVIRLQPDGTLATSGAAGSCCEGPARKLMEARCR